MEKYLLDTDTCIALLKAKHNIHTKIQDAGIENCFVSEITIAELFYGASFSGNYEKHLQDVHKVEGLLNILPMYECLPLFGKEKARLRRDGNLIPDFDLLIGATAVHYDMILVTNNTAHLSRITDIKLANWMLD